MPSERNRSKEDTWTPDELNKALKRDDGRKHRDDREQRRKDRHRDEMNGEDRQRRKKDDDEKRHRDDDRRSRNKEEDRRRNDSEERKSQLTEDERERQRRERREKREGKSKPEDDKKKGREDDKKKRPVIDDDDDADTRNRDRDEERERRRQKHEDDDKHKRHRTDDDRDKRHQDEGDRRRHHRDDDDDEKERRRRKDEDKRRDDRGSDRKKQREDEDHERRKDRRDKDRPREDEDDRERQRRERRDKREGKDKDRDKDRDHDRERRKRDEEEEERRRRKQEEKEREERKGKERSYGRSRDDRKFTRRGRKGKDTGKKEEEEDYADEEFEEYEDDFDDEETAKPAFTVKTSKQRSSRTGQDDEMDDLLSALDKENERLLEESRVPSSRPRNRYQDNWEDDRYNERKDDKDDRDEDQPKVSRSKTLINFVGAKKRAMTSHASSVIGKRAEDLLQMIELDTAIYDIFDMPPVKEYDLYIRSFGRSDTTQAYVQTNDDDIEREVQTDEIDLRQKWTQHPAEDYVGCGRGDGEKDIEEEEQSHKQLDLSRLSKFVQKAGQVISILLDEDKDLAKTDVSENKSHLGVSEGYTQLARLPILQGRCVLFSQFAPSQPNMLITAYSKPAQEDEGNSITRKGIVCVWNTDEPSYPQRILACESQPTCCCFSPYKTSLAFAGMVDGSICVWDLREQLSMHPSVSYDNQDHVLRYPTFNTAGVMDSDNHLSPVTSLNPVASYSLSISDSGGSTSEDTGTGLSFQLISCEEQGILNFWVVAEINAPDLAGSETDLGLSPGGKIKLIKSSAIVLQHPPRYKRIGDSLRATELQLAPTDPNHYYVGTDSGYILHGLRFGTRAFPSSYSTGSEAPMDVTTIDFSPFGHPCFLVSCSDGSVHLYNIKSEMPIMSWTAKIWDTQNLRCVRWSRSRPCVFFVLDDSARLYTFDILEGDAMPAKIDTLSSQDRVAHLQFTTDIKPTSQGRLPHMLVSLESGQTEIHTIRKQYREKQTLESDFLPSYLDRF